MGSSMRHLYGMPETAENKRAAFMDKFASYMAERKQAVEKLVMDNFNKQANAQPAAQTQQKQASAQPDARTKIMDMIKSAACKKGEGKCPKCGNSMKECKCGKEAACGKKGKCAAQDVTKTTLSKAPEKPAQGDAPKAGNFAAFKNTYAKCK